MPTYLRLSGLIAATYSLGCLAGLLVISLGGGAGSLPSLTGAASTYGQADRPQGRPRGGSDPEHDSWTLEDADASALQGDWTLAGRQYEAIAAAWNGRVSDAVAFRIALAEEATGRLDRAVDAYQRLRNESESATFRAAAELGLSRVWDELGRHPNARHGLWAFLLQEGNHARLPAELLGEAAHQLAHQLKRQISSGEPADLLDPSTIVPAPLPRCPQHVLRWLRNHGADASPSEATVTRRVADMETPALTSRRLAPLADEIYITARLPTGTVATTVEMLAVEADIPIVLSVAARQRLAERSLPLDVRDLKLSILLDGMADVLQLVWTEADGRIDVRCCDEVDEATVNSFFAQATERMLHRALTEFLDHRWTEASSWAIANLAFARNEFELAIHRYQRLLDDSPRLVGREYVHFNLAKSFLAARRTPQALDAFFRSVDQGLGRPIEPVAYLHTGRLLIEDDQLARAARSLRRSLALANSDPVRAQSALALAGLHLLKDSPHDANQALMAHRSMLSAEPYRDQAAFLAALARYRAAQPTAQRRLGLALLESLTHVQPDGFWGAHGFLLIAMAYRELGLVDLANSVLTRGSQQEHLGRIREWMLFELAVNHYHSGSLAPSDDALRALMLGRPGRWSEPAQLLLIQTEFDAGNDQACLRLCRKLLAESNQASTRTSVLNLMGRVYQRQGEYLRAAMCFSGYLPSSESDSLSKTENRSPEDAHEPQERRQNVSNR